MTTSSTGHMAVIIPVLNEAEALPKVIASIPPSFRAKVIVVDNGSTDGTPEIARQCGATVVEEPRRGYGSACLAGIAALGKADIVVFLDGDYSDYPEEMPSLVSPIVEGRADMVIGSRMIGQREPGALPPHSVFGNWLASTLLRLIYGQRVTDLGPFRAIRFQSLVDLDMRDTGYGWTVEMQIKATRRGLRVLEVPVRYRKRIGVSKISGNVKASVNAGIVILSTLARYSYSFSDRGRNRSHNHFLSE